MASVPGDVQHNRSLPAHRPNRCPTRRTRRTCMLGAEGDAGVAGHTVESRPRHDRLFRLGRWGACTR